MTLGSPQPRNCDTLVPLSHLRWIRRDPSFGGRFGSIIFGWGGFGVHNFLVGKIKHPSLLRRRRGECGDFEEDWSVCPQCRFFPRVATILTRWSCLLAGEEKEEKKHLDLLPPFLSFATLAVKYLALVHLVCLYRGLIVVLQSAVRLKQFFLFWYLSVGIINTNQPYIFFKVCLQATK